MGGWMENILYSFQDGNDGGVLTAGLIFDQSGNLYGASTHGGTGGGGTVFELSPPGSWNTLSGLYSIYPETPIATVPRTGGPPGPASTLVMDAEGNLYGTTCADGAYGYGNVFKLTPFSGGWSYTLSARLYWR